MENNPLNPKPMPALDAQYPGYNFAKYQMPDEPYPRLVGMTRTQAGEGLMMDEMVKDSYEKAAAKMYSLLETKREKRKYSKKGYEMEHWTPEEWQHLKEREGK